MSEDELRAAILPFAERVEGNCRRCGRKLGGEAAAMPLATLAAWLYGFCGRGCQMEAVAAGEKVGPLTLESVAKLRRDSEN